MARTQQQDTQNTEDTPGSTRFWKKGTLYCRTLEDLFIIRPLLLRAEDVADFTNTKRQREVDKMRRQRNMPQMKEQDSYNSMEAKWK